MKKISIRDVRAMLPHLDKLLAREGELVITRRGTPIARLLPARPAGARPSHAEFRARMPRLTVGSEVFVRQDRDER